MRRSTKVQQVLLVLCAVILGGMVVANLLHEIPEKSTESVKATTWHLECIDGVNYINYRGSFSVKFNTDSTVSLCNVVKIN